MRAAWGVAAGFVIGVVAAGVTVAAVHTEPEVEDTVTVVCRGLAANLANETYQLFGLVGVALHGDAESVPERLEIHAENWDEKVVGMADVCGVDLPGGGRA